MGDRVWGLDVDQGHTKLHSTTFAGSSFVPIERRRHGESRIGRRFRIGYYSRQDGLDCIWLVNEKGE